MTKESEPDMIIDSALRYKIVLGKFPVQKVIQRGAYLEFIIGLPNGITLQVTGPIADVREGDLLTLYTEILANPTGTRQ